MKNTKEVVYRGKKMTVYDCSIDEHFISHMVSHGEGWDNDIIDYIISISDNSKGMIDVGGEIGTYTIALAEHFKTITTFEPNLENYIVLKNNLSLNNIKNVYLYNSAIGSDFGFCNMITKHNNIVDVGEGNIKISPLDSFNIENCQFLKIDVEGHELEVLLGAKQTINRNKPIIYLETHPTIRYNIDIECESLLHSYGYIVTKEIKQIDKFWEYKQ